LKKQGQNMATVVVVVDGNKKGNSI